MEHVLDLRDVQVGARNRAVKRDYSLLYVFAAYAVFFVLGLAYMLWVDSGCDLNGIVTMAGRVCA